MRGGYLGCPGHACPQVYLSDDWHSLNARLISCDPEAKVGALVECFDSLHSQILHFDASQVDVTPPVHLRLSHTEMSQDPTSDPLLTSTSHSGAADETRGGASKTQSENSHSFSQDVAEASRDGGDTRASDAPGEVRGEEAGRGGLGNLGTGEEMVSTLIAATP